MCKIECMITGEKINYDIAIIQECFRDQPTKNSQQITQLNREVLNGCMVSPN